MVDGHGTPGLDLTAKIIACEKGADCSNLVDSNPHQGESETTEESVEETDEPDQSLKRSGRSKRTAVRFSGTKVMALEDTVTYEEAMRGRKKSGWKLDLKDDLESIERTADGPTFSCLRTRIPSRVRWYWRERWMSKDVLLAVRCISSQGLRPEGWFWLRRYVSANQTIRCAFLHCWEVYISGLECSSC